MPIICVALLLHVGHANREKHKSYSLAQYSANLTENVHVFHTIKFLFCINTLMVRFTLNDLISRIHSNARKKEHKLEILYNFC